MFRIIALDLRVSSLWGRIDTSMTKTDIISLLSAFYDLSDNKRDILILLAKGDMTPAEILANSSVSNGRIYAVLAQLEETEIITKIPGKPAVYTMGDFVISIRNFLNWSFGKHIEAKTKVTDALAALQERTDIETLMNSKERYDSEIESMLKSAKWIKLIHKHISLPWYLYSYLPEKDFLKVRQEIAKTRLIGSSNEVKNLLAKRDAYLETYKTKSVEHIMLRESFEKYMAMLTKLFGDKKAKNTVLEIKTRLLGDKNVKVYVLEKLFTPFSTYISDKEVIIPMFFEKKQNRMLKMRGIEVIKTYTDLFEEYKSGAVLLVRPHLVR